MLQLQSTSPSLPLGDRLVLVLRLLHQTNSRHSHCQGILEHQIGQWRLSQASPYDILGLLLNLTEVQCALTDHCRLFYVSAFELPRRAYYTRHWTFDILLSFTFSQRTYLIIHGLGVQLYQILQTFGLTSKDAEFRGQDDIILKTFCNIFGFSAL